MMQENGFLGPAWGLSRVSTIFDIHTTTMLHHTSPRGIQCLAVVVLFVSGFFGPQTAAAQCDVYRCVRVLTKYNKTCGNPTDCEATWQNICGEKLDLKNCIQKMDGKWDCGIKFDVPPNGKSVYWTCNSSGKTYVWCRPSGSQIPFPTQQQIEAMRH